MERLQKIIAQAGIASRRKAEVLITEGRVSVNGEVVRELGVKVSNHDSVEVDGVPIYKEEPVYFLFFKPKGVITANSDDKGRKVVLDYFSHVKARIFPVGRLDWDTTGALILTNDGDFANKMTHPKHEIEKEYVAKVKGIATKENLKPLVYGVKIDGRKTAKARYEIISVDMAKGTSIVSLTIHEGRNHQVKKMFEAVGLPVQKLKRERIGNLTLKGLRHGEYRTLSKKEISQLLSGKVE
ncbi:23S rRNA pseudouridine2605 synthase [Pilibacter termitis]|uniref:Pseudouridine synthase n=1 Tax=Pilibacter termitis TaxID=263852 RepID=A0A1T4QMF9_9ENTE|nr:pseudouridine synthase [Pilibacter termitis]SKA04953.1 23S rRNA pseudouridine2605 synthase [Pilibacter termitis]